MIKLPACIISLIILASPIQAKIILEGACSPELVSHIESETKRLEEFFETDAGSIFVFVAENREQFDSATGNTLPEWGFAAAIPRMSKIILLSQEKLNPSVVTHELTHILLHKKTENSCIPRWFDEGVAQLLSCEVVQGSTIRLAFASLSGKLIELPDIDDVNIFHSDKAHLAYAESYIAVKLLYEKVGKERLIRFIADIPKLGFERAMLYHFGITESGYNKILFDHIRRHYNIFSIFLDQRVIFLVFLLLLFISYIRVKIRNRRKIREWENEEGPTHY